MALFRLSQPIKFHLKSPPVCAAEIYAEIDQKQRTGIRCSVAEFAHFIKSKVPQVLQKKNVRDGSVQCLLTYQDETEVKWTQTGSDVSGIFRLSPTVSGLKKAMEDFETGEIQQYDDKEHVITVAAVLKQYLHNRPPLVPVRLYNQLLTIQNGQTGSGQKKLMGLGQENNFTGSGLWGRDMLQKNVVLKQLNTLYFETDTSAGHHPGQRQNVDDSDTETTHHTVLNMEQTISDFLAQIKPIQIHIDKIKALVEEVKQLQNITLNIETDQKTKQELEQKMDEIKKISDDVRIKLKTGRTKSEAQLDEMLTSGNFNGFSEGIMVETQEAKQNLADIEARHREFVKIEKSLIEVNEMFHEIAALIQTQGTMIDSIEYNTKKSTDWVIKGKNEVKKAEDGKKARQKTIGVIVIVIAILLIIIIVLASIFGSKR
ncbi:unnamed protein product [Didymodactylos carnosus]|uniref:t-SNARE coiled-coil homology domain-containing protein n=2 Tax=Didymodactylos carnosus TaxID=1234261 RepID=A0A8S2DGX4_9BILA|nr:unnamed protein product [Didymodactylos carnosus]CAF3675041.1 unnamed protein product [Didymodactylos carnosus]